MPAAEAVDALGRLGFAPRLDGDAIACTVPSWRQDVSIEVDLVEEVARTIGYARIPTRDTIELRVTPPQEDLRAADQVRQALVAAGYYEALTFSWVTDALRDDFAPAEAKGLLRADELVRKDNAHLRPSLLPGLLEAVRRNETVGNPRAKLFEIGSTFWVDAAGNVDERRRLAVVGSGDYREVRGAVEAVLESLDAGRAVRVIPGERKGYAPAAAGRIEWGGQPVGHVGKVDRAVAEKLGLRDVPFAAELEFAPLIAGARPLPQVRELAKYPPVKRDLSLVVGERVRYEEIASIVRDLKLPDLEAVEYVTTYRGKQVGDGRKSVTVELVFRSESGTLTGEAVEASVQRVVSTAREKVNAELRA